MRKLTLSLFTQVNEDQEIRQYHILSCLKSIQERFNKNMLYPHLKDIIDIYTQLIHIKEQLTLDSAFKRKRLRSIDLEKKELIYEYESSSDVNIPQVEQLIDWALPKIKVTVQEGITLFDFVKSHLNITSVGIVPNYHNEGYLFIPETSEHLRLFRYELSLFNSSSDVFRSIKTSYLKSVESSTLVKSLNDIKLDLITEYSDLPTPAAFHFDSKLELPFQETLFPVAKRTFLEHLHKKAS